MTDSAGQPRGEQQIIAVTMPKWGLSMQLGKITEWMVCEGDEVGIGDDVADIETDKIAGTLEADNAGTVRRLIARVGEDVPVSGTIALLTAGDVSEEDLDAAVARARAEIDAGAPDDAAGGPVVESVRSGDRKISYAGVGTDGDVVLLIHGYGGDRNSWLFVQQPLAEHGRVYALDLPGHGTSSKDVGDGSLEVLADAAADVLDAVGARHAHLVGHSLGAAVAIAVAARDPGRIASMTLLAPAGFGTAIDADYVRGFAAAETRRELRPLAGRLFADDGLVTRQVVDDLLAYKRLDGVRAALETLAGTLLDGDRQRLEANAALATLSGAIPVAVVWGAQDQIIPAAQAESAAESVPGAARQVLDGAGHMVHMEKPYEVLAAIRAAMTSSRG